MASRLTFCYCDRCSDCLEEEEPLGPLGWYNPKNCTHSSLTQFERVWVGIGFRRFGSDEPGVSASPPTDSSFVLAISPSLIVSVSLVSDVVAVLLIVCIPLVV